MTSDQVGVGDEGQSWSTFDNIFHILSQEIGQVAEGAKDSKAGDKGCEAVGDADEEDVEDNVLEQVVLLPTQIIHVKEITQKKQKQLATDLVEPVEAGKGGHGGVASTE